MSSKLLFVVFAPIFVLIVFAFILLKRKGKSIAPNQVHQPRRLGAAYDTKEIERGRAVGRSINDNNFGG